ncbi:MAG: hypothetical protein EXR70_01095 [Deltaproteobacteria bacterium]|nr:hypothetical protein [Deltaproteobacteria bacterium]
MRLAQSFKILTSTTPGTFARALRVIGQDLADLFPDTVEIKFHGETFVVSGRCAKSRLDARQPTPQRKGLKEFCADFLSRDVTALGQKGLTASVEFNQRYAAEDINRIDDIGISRRFTAGKLPDIHSLAEMLRTIGRLVDGQKGQLVKISKDARRVVFEFTASDGKTHNELMTIPDLYKLQKRFYEGRSAPVGSDPWRNGK